MLEADSAECAGGEASSSGSANVSELSALEKKEEETINKTLNDRKVDLPSGLTHTHLRESVEEDFGIYKNGPQTLTKQYELIQKLEKEETINKAPPIFENSDQNQKQVPTPATNAVFNEIRNFEEKIQDGKGGGNPKDCAFLEKEEKGQNSQSFGVRKRDPP